MNSSQTAAATAAAFLCLLALLPGCKPAATAARPAAAAPPHAAAAGAAVPDAPAPARYADELAALEATIGEAHNEVQRYPNSWAPREQLALLHLRRARLSGDYENYSAARALIDEAQGLAGNPTAVCASRAQLEFAVHRLAQAAAAVALCEQRFGLSADAQQDLSGMAAEIALYRGRYDEALRRLRSDLAAVETIAGLARLSRYQAKTGHRVEALALLDRAERSYFGDSQQLRAWLQLQRAVIELDTGRWENARAYLLAAERQLSGWWLIEEHLAEVQALLDETEAARGLYRGIVQRTGLPEYLDAWATLEFGAGNQAQAGVLRAKAAGLFEERLARWPEAAAGHALGHFLKSGSDPRRAVALAEANARSRPYGDAQVQLAQAYLLAGRRREARAVVDAALQSPWDTAELHWTAAQVYAAVGEGAAAAVQRRLALELNPRAERQYGLLTAAAPMVVGARRNGPP